MKFVLLIRVIFQWSTIEMRQHNAWTNKIKHKDVFSVDKDITYREMPYNCSSKLALILDILV